MGAKHKRTWSIVRHGTRRPSGYQASIADLGSDRATSVAFNLVNWLISIFAWLGASFDIVGFEPRYRVLVGRPGADELIGVREARTLRKAHQQLAEVEAVLAQSTEEGARDALGLGF